MGAVRKFVIMPRRWRGARSNDPSVLIGSDEWASSTNFDARFSRTNLGSVVTVTANPLPNPATEVLGLANYYDTNSLLTRVWVDSDGDVYEEDTIVDVFRAGSFTLATSTDPIPTFAAGTGAIVVCRGSDGKPLWKDPADATWKDMTGAPATGVITAAFEVGGPRLFVAPGTLGNDSMAWSEAGDIDDFAATGSGEEAVGNDREDIVALFGGLEKNMAIYKRNHIYIRSGTDPDSWSIVPVSNDVGLTAPNSLINIGKAHFFVHESGAYFLNAAGVISFPSLTFKIQDIWDTMVSTFGAYLRYATAAYHPRENTIYLWIPNQSTRIMNRLVKIYLADGAVTVHDGKDTGGSHFFPTTTGGQIEYGKASELLKVSGVDDDGTAITVAMTSGIFSGNPPSFDIEKRWGKRGILHFFFEVTTGNETIKITPNVYRVNAKTAGVQQSFALTSGQVSKVKVKIPDQAGWGFDYDLAGTFSTGHVRLIGIAGEYEEITDE